MSLLYEIGLKLAGSAIEPHLWTGVMNADLSICGNYPVFMEDFMMLQSILAIGTLPFFKILVGTPSGPGAALFGRRSRLSSMSR